jgi:uncharacterized protein
MIVESVLWRCLQWPGHEAARIIELPGSWIIEGTASFAQDGKACSLIYSIVCGEDWVTQWTRVTGSVGDRVIDVEVDATSWPLKECVDIDLNFSPSTNTLPIRRLNLAVGERAEVAAAWLRFPSFELERLDQEYARTGEETYTYRNQASGYTAELRVSRNGLVLDYGDIWAFVSPRA